MKKRDVLAMLSTLCLAAAAHANTYSNVSTIKGLTVENGNGRVRLVLDDMTAAKESCATDPWYAFSLSTLGAKEMYASLLAAKFAGQRVFVQANGCEGPYSSVTLVYVCDAMWCQ